MNSHFSVFLVLANNILEIAYSRDDSINNQNRDFNDRYISISQLLVLFSLFYSSQWKKWLFFVLQVADGENYRIDSCRDYPRENFTGLDIRPLLLNEYDLIVDQSSESCFLRVDKNEREELHSLIESYMEVSTFLKKAVMNKEPLHSEFQKNISQIRTLDLKLILKRICLITPEIQDVRQWIIKWNPITSKEFKELKNEFFKNEFIEGIQAEPLLPIFSQEELKSRNWTIYRQARLEQPFGLICPSCLLQYEPNISAKFCNSCNNLLRKA
ncbi:MAG: hypothetical protein ACFFAU_19855 [Candidatus Hodarchaeota archaeon]